jgi:hypothetical protein
MLSGQKGKPRGSNKGRFWQPVYLQCEFSSSSKQTQRRTHRREKMQVQRRGMTSQVGRATETTTKPIKTAFFSPPRFFPLCFEASVPAEQKNTAGDSNSQNTGNPLVGARWFTTPPCRAVKKASTFKPHTKSRSVTYVVFERSFNVHECI